MNPSLDELLHAYWRQSEHTEEWRRLFNNAADRKRLLKQVLPYLPEELGELEFLEDLPGKQFILLVTYDEDSKGARENAAQIFSALAETRVITFFGTEGAWGRVDLEWLRVFPDKNILRSFAKQQLDSFDFAPLEYSAIICEESVDVWGIEDRKLYERTGQAYSSGSFEYGHLIERRTTVLFENLLSEMKKRRITLACASLTAYNFSAAHSWLLRKRIAHAGIRSASSGRSYPGRLDASLQGQIIDGFRQALQDIHSEPEVSTEDEETVIEREQNLALSPQNRLNKLGSLNMDSLRRCQQLAVLPAETTFDWTLAAALWGDAEEDANLTSSALDDLYNFAILERNQGTGRFFLSPILYILLQPENQSSIALDRYRAYVISLTERFKSLPLHMWSPLVPEFPHIHYVGNELLSRVEKLSIDLESLAGPEPAPLPFATSLEIEARAVLAVGSDFAAAVHKYVACRSNTGDWEQRWLQMGLVSARVLGQQQRIALFLSALGAWHAKHDSPERALVYLERALAIRRQMGDQAGEAATLSDMGLAHMANEQTELALAEYKQALDIMSEIGERDGEARTLVRMATLYRSTNQPAQALELLEQALQISREQGNKANEAFALAESGLLVHDELNQSVEGIFRIKQAIVIFKTYHLSQTLGGNAHDQLQALLSKLQGQSDGLVQLEQEEQQEQPASDSVQPELQEQPKTCLKTPVIAGPATLVDARRGSSNKGTAWLTSTLPWLPLLIPLVGYSAGTMPIPLLLDRGYDQLLLSILVVSWILLGQVVTRPNNVTRESVLTQVATFGLVVTSALVLSLARDQAISYGSVLLAGVAIAVAVGLAGGLASDITDRSLLALVVTVASVIAVFASKTVIFDLGGGLLAIIAGVVAFFLALAVAGIVTLCMIALLRAIVEFGVKRGLAGIALIALLSGAIVSLIDGLWLGLAIGVAFLTAVQVTSGLQKSKGGRFASWLMYGMSAFYCLILVWIYLLGGWRY